MAVIASFLIGANGASTKSGLSIGLSTPADRKRFLERHRSAAAFIIGKNSAQVESYSQTKVPIFVFTRKLEKLTLPHPLMQQFSVDFGMAEIVRGIDERIEGDIVVEAGRDLLLALLSEKVIDLLELTISPIPGDGNFVELSELTAGAEIEEEIADDGTRLLQCRYKSDSAHG